MRIVVASEHRGFDTKLKILCQLREMNYTTRDCGPLNAEPCDYPDYAAQAARAVSTGEFDRAILIGGTGIGMCIVANKFRGVRAALCHDDVSAQLSRRHHDANVLCVSTDVLDEQLTMQMLRLWLETPFEGGHHARRIAKIAQCERATHQ